MGAMQTNTNTHTHTYTHKSYKGIKREKGLKLVPVMQRNHLSTTTSISVSFGRLLLLVFDSTICNDGPGGLLVVLFWYYRSPYNVSLLIISGLMPSDFSVCV